MVSTRCKMVVLSEMENLGLKVISVELGVAETEDWISQEQKKQLDNNLKKLGLELVEARKEVLTERIKATIIDLVHNSNAPLTVNLSDYLIERLNYDYTYLSNIFSEVTGSSIGKFFIQNKIEKVKELIIYDELNLKEISEKVQYSSIGHLSNQFKRFTGLAPSEYRKLKHRNRFAIDQLIAV